MKVHYKQISQMCVNEDTCCVLDFWLKSQGRNAVATDSNQRWSCGHLAPQDKFEYIWNTTSQK